MAPPATAASRSAALARIKAAKQGIGSSSRLDEVDYDHDDDDVYDVVDEAQYQQLVATRRERQDFVVDDDGLGYHDDGEERWYDASEAGTTSSTKKQHKRNATATLTAKALKMARQGAAALSMNNKGNGGGGGAGVKSKSMWDFVNRGTVGKANESSSSSSNSKPAAAAAAAATKPLAANVDDLLSTLDDDDVLLLPPSSSLSSRHRRNSKKRPVSRSRRAAAAAAAPPPSRARRLVTAAAAGNVRSHAPDNDDDDDGYVDLGGDDDDIPTPPPSPGSTSSTPPAKFRDNGAGANAPTPASAGKSVRFADDTTMEAADNHNVPMKNADPDAVVDPVVGSGGGGGPRRHRRVVARPKLGQLSAPAQQAARAKKEKEEQALLLKAKVELLPAWNNIPSMMPDSMSQHAATAAPPAAAAVLNTQAQLADFVQTNDDDDDDVTYIDMFWMDMTELRNGQILLFGKVHDQAQNTFVSACAVVSHNVRNLFVLPRSDAAFLDVHQEINRVLKTCLPAVGAAWAGKKVSRSYAFGDASVPRTPTEYLKVVYDAQYPPPADDICQQGGQHFAKILNAGASLTETFLIKRKLMGPCWLRVQQPTELVLGAAPRSWCKLEFNVDSPKLVTRLDLALQNVAPADVTTAAPIKVPPPPPVVTMTLKLKTVANSKTHKSEIVAVAAVCHQHVMLETASDEQRHVQHLTLVRPLAMDNNGGGVAQFPRDLEPAVQSHMPSLRREPNESALLQRLLVQFRQWDPDVVVAHNAWGFDVEVLLARCADLKIRSWSMLGRRRRAELPNKSHLSARRDWAIGEAVAGRLLCDTYLSAQELLRETTYSLTHLAATQLKVERQEIEPVDVPLYFGEGKTVVQLALATHYDAVLVQRLMFKLQILPLSKQLTCIAGNLWSQTLKSNRAVRTEFLLLHEFHRCKYLPPEKRRAGAKTESTGGRAKPKYSGGLVLEPKKGLYDSYILLLDFNSLYPSIIQEYNLCFTTIDWSQFTGVDDMDVDDENAAANSVNLPPLPDADVEGGVLPRVIKSLVERRRNVKKLLKNEKDVEKRGELDIRQQALKLTANSMYGCLGFSNSRFFAQPIAALVTAMGRETLQKTVDIAQQKIGLDVIYGDTDSIMINTRINDEGELSKVRELGERVKKEVNRLYKTLELEIDGIFRSMLLLKKKKYAAKTVIELPDGSVTYGEELKGLDLVRRDWCIQSKETGRYVTEQILSGQDTELVVQNIHTHLSELAKKMRSNELPLDKYTITKGLSKHPNEYPDGKSQPHVQVAKQMLKNDRPVNTGDHIPYIITAPIEAEDKKDPSLKAPSATERARHPEEILRSNGVLKPDVEWYLENQILPPVARLCDPIEGTSQQRIAEVLELDSSKFRHVVSSNDVDNEAIVDFTPASALPDTERFKDVKKFQFTCKSCGETSDFPGVFRTELAVGEAQPLVFSGLRCPNATCEQPKLWGRLNHFECYAHLDNAMTVYVNEKMYQPYYAGTNMCDEPGCHLKTRQLSVVGPVCLRRGCHGQCRAIEPDQTAFTKAKYLATLFDVEHACEQLEKRKVGIAGSKNEMTRMIHKHDRAVFAQLAEDAQAGLAKVAYNFIDSSFWNVFRHGVGNKTKQ